jgi:uncharacterized membrane protein YozB (DUF420 family)
MDPNESAAPVSGCSIVLGRSGSPHRGGVQQHFFVIMASLVTVTVFAGFAPSFYLRGAFQPDQKLSILLHVKGVVFSAWIILFLVQAILIARGSRALHRRLGWFAATIAICMVGLVAAATVEEMRRVPPTPPAPVALALNTFDTVVFAILVGSAIYLRKQAEWHKRFLLSATLVLLGAPVLRLLILLGGQVSHTSLILDVLVVDLCFLICFASDLYTRRRIHPAYCCALGLLVADQITTFSVMSWAPWINFANAVQRFVS